MNHWNRYHARWSRILPPLRPNREVVASLRALVGSAQASILLLGVTPELAGAFENVHAIDKSAEMIANVWPGDTPARKAIHGNWLSPLGHDADIDAVIGDGSLNAIWYPDEVRTVIDNAIQALVPGGIFICRMFERPEVPYSQRHLQRVTAEPAQMNFHAFKWQLAMHLAHEQGTNVAVASILEKFNEMWPDRKTLADTTGWDRDTIDSIDVYRGSDAVYSFPDRSEITSIVPEGATDIRFTASGTYQLADRCPLVSFRKPR